MNATFTLDKELAEAMFLSVTNRRQEEMPQVHKDLDKLTEAIYYAATGRKELVEVLSPVLRQVALEVQELWSEGVRVLSEDAMKMVITGNTLVVHPTK